MELETRVEELQVSTGIDLHNEIWFQALHYIFVLSPSAPILGLLALSEEIIINLNGFSLMATISTGPATTEDQEHFAMGMMNLD